MKAWKALGLGLKNCNLLIIINNILTNSNEAEKERIKMNIKETESKNITSENPVNDRIVKITGKFMKENQNNFKLKDRSEVFLNRKKDLKIDAFTHILTPNFFKDIKELNPKIPQMFGTLINEPLVNVDTRRKYHSEYSDVKEIINAAAPSNILIALAIVLGAVGLIMLVARKMKFHPVGDAITAGE